MTTRPGKVRRGLGLHRLLWLLLVPLFGLLVWLWLNLAYLPQPQQIVIDAAGATGRLTSDDLYAADAAVCTTVRWQIDGVRAVVRDGAPVAAAGSAPLCADSTFTLTFADGTSADYVLVYRVLAGHLVVFGVLSSAVLVGGAVTLVLNRPGVTRGTAATQDTRSTQGQWDAAGDPRWALALLIGVLLAAWWVRLGAAVRVPLYIDEAWTYTEFAEPPLYDGVRHYWAANNHVLNTLLIHLTTRVWGDAEIGVRMPALLIGLLSIAAVYQAGRTLYSRRVGVMAAAISAMYPLVSEYGWQARGYNGVLVCTFVLLVLAARQARRPTRARWLAFGLVGVVGLYFIPTMLYALVLVSAWLVAQWWIVDGVHSFRERRLWTLAAVIAGAGLVALVLYTPQIHYLLTTPDLPIDPGAGALFLDADTYIYRVLIFETAHHWQMAGGGLTPALLIALGLGVAAAWLSGQQPRRLASDPLLTMLPLGLILLVAHRPTFMLRTWLFYLPLIALTTAVGWSYLIARAVGWAARRQTAATRARVERGLIGAACGLVLAVGGGYLLDDAHAIITGREGDAVWAGAPALGRRLADEPQVMTLSGYLCYIVEYYSLRGGTRHQCGTDTEMLLIVREMPDAPAHNPDWALDRYALRAAGYRIEQSPRLVVEDAFVWRIWRAGTAP